MSDSMRTSERDLCPTCHGTGMAVLAIPDMAGTEPRPNRAHPVTPPQMPAPFRERTYRDVEIGSAPDALREASAPVPSAESAKKKDDDDSGAGLIGATDTGHGDTLPRPSSEPLGCPFCGGKAYAVRTVNGTQMFKVGCAACGIELKAAWYRDEERPTKDLIGLWNMRSPEARERRRHQMPTRKLYLVKETRVIAARGVLSVFWPETPESGERMEAFREGLRALGFLIEEESAQKENLQSVDRFRDQVIQAGIEASIDWRVQPSSGFVYSMENAVALAAARCALTQAREQIKQTGNVENAYWVLDALIAALTP